MLAHLWRRRVDVWIVAALASALLLVAPSAHAYPWMIRHDYVGCGTCHLDPSGGGLLTEYGRAQGDLLLRTRYTKKVEEPGRSAGFLWGLITPPRWLLLGGDARGLALDMKTDGASFVPSFILMQADFRAGVKAGGFRAAASIGIVSSQGSAASLAGNVVSREHWLGYAFGEDDAFLVRAGRINLPYGLRNIDHTLFVRSATRTDLNDTQQDGVAFGYSGELVRGEVMAIAGNYQVSPDAYRERGYSAFVEIAPLTRMAFGVSSLWTHAAKDLYLQVANTRQADGVFARLAPWRPLVLMLEADLVEQSPEHVPKMTGYATLVQGDLEVIQGVHVIVTGENFYDGAPGDATSWDGRLSGAWFFAPHADVRADFMRESLAIGATHVGITALMGQLHFYL